MLLFRTLSDACAASTMRPSSLKEPCWSAGSKADLRRMFNQISKNTILLQVEDLASRGGLLYRQAGSPESAAQKLVNDFHVRMKYYLNMTLRSNKYLEVKEEIILSR